MTAAAAAHQLDPPPVTAADDRDWFATRPQRRYRARRAERGFWIVRKRAGGVFLRTWAATLPKGMPDTDAALREAWFLAVWPELDPKERDALVCAARRSEKGATGA
jgi:hypothetical protein